MSGACRSQRGLALIEVIVAIVLISALAAVVLSQVTASAQGGSAVLLAAEADSVADAYVELIQRRAFIDPDGVDGETVRSEFDDVDDYNGIHDVGARDSSGNVIAALTALDVRVRVVPSNALTGVVAANVRRIDVTVRDRAGRAHLATAYKLRP